MVHLHSRELFNLFYTLSHKFDEDFVRYHMYKKLFASQIIVSSANMRHIYICALLLINDILLNTTNNILILAIIFDKPIAFPSEDLFQQLHCCCSFLSTRRVLHL